MLLVLLVPYAASTAVTINSTSALCHCVASADVADAGAVSCLGSGRVTAINCTQPLLLVKPHHHHHHLHHHLHGRQHGHRHSQNHWLGYCHKFLYPSVVGQLKVQVLFVSSLCPSCGQRLHSKVCHNKERAQEWIFLIECLDVLQELHLSCLCCVDRVSASVLKLWWWAEWKSGDTSSER